MSSTEETINNAISLLLRTAYEAQGHGEASLGKVGAIQALSDHWARFWRSSERSLLPTAALRGKLARYVEWYTRAWVLLPASYRGLVPRPDTLDPTLSKVARDTLAGYITGVASTPQMAREIAQRAEEQARSLKQTIESGLVTTGVGAILGGLFVYWFFIRGGRK